MQYVIRKANSIKNSITIVVWSRLMLSAEQTNDWCWTWNEGDDNQLLSFMPLTKLQIYIRVGIIPNHIQMYVANFVPAPPFYEAWTIIAALECNHHMDSTVWKKCTLRDCGSLLCIFLFLGISCQHHASKRVIVVVEWNCSGSRVGLEW